MLVLARYNSSLVECGYMNYACFTHFTVITQFTVITHFTVVSVSLAHICTYLLWKAGKLAL